MREKRIYLLLLLAIYTLPSIAQVASNYEFEIDKDLWKKEKINFIKRLDDKYINDGNLYMHFQSSFEDDSLKIKINGKPFGSYKLTTEWSTELAKVVVIPDFLAIKNISLCFNGGKEIRFEINEMNQIIVRNRNNKIYIGYSKHVYYYD